MKAAKIAELCGFEGVSLVGDVFVARRYQEGAIRHLSFTLLELDSAAEWMKKAHADNYQFGVENGQVRV